MRCFKSDVIRFGAVTKLAYYDNRRFFIPSTFLRQKTKLFDFFLQSQLYNIIFSQTQGDRTIELDMKFYDEQFVKNSGESC